MSDVIKAVTDQFALINVDSDADLRAVGAALCRFPKACHRSLRVLLPSVTRCYMPF